MIQAVKDKIIVEEMIRAKTSGGLVIPDSAVIDPQSYGRVVSVGAEVQSLDIAEGDILTFHIRGGMAAVFKNQAFRIIKYDEVYGKVTDPEIIEELDIIKIGAVPDKKESPIIVE
jgi:co-chaperonin GroES (HSP10)